MFGSNFLTALITAIQESLIDGILGWLTQLFSVFFPST